MSLPQRPNLKLKKKPRPDLPKVSIPVRTADTRPTPPSLLIQTQQQAQQQSSTQLQIESNVEGNKNRPHAHGDYSLGKLESIEDLINVIQKDYSGSSKSGYSIDNLTQETQNLRLNTGMQNVPGNYGNMTMAEYQSIQNFKEKNKKILSSGRSLSVIGAPSNLRKARSRKLVIGGERQEEIDDDLRRDATGENSQFAGQNESNDKDDNGGSGEGTGTGSGVRKLNKKAFSLQPPPQPQDPASFSSQQPLTSVIEEFDFKEENIEVLDKLGEGSVGTVHKIRYIPTGKIMARKLVGVYPDEATIKQLVRELSFLKKCDSPWIIKFYGTYYLEEGQCICMCMEFCNGGSLDSIYKKVASMNGRIGEGVLGKISEAVLNGLVYLHAKQIIHRDIKPSNILVTGTGQIKLCDFGVSGELVNSIAQTFVGTSYYMAPERIQGFGYAVQSDVWSLGLTILEVALGRFPFPPAGSPPLTVIELLDYIIRAPAPSLDPRYWSKEIVDFTTKCLIKSPKERPTPIKLLEEDEFVQKSSKLRLDLKKWIKQVWST